MPQSYRAALALLAAFVAAGVGVLALLLGDEPRFYRDSHVEPGVPRTRLSREVEGNLANLMNNLFLNNQPAWDATFTADQINSYLEEGFIRSGTRDKVLPDGWSAPRVAIGDDRVRVAARYGRGPLKTVVSLDLRLWLVAGESNTVAMELMGLKAGRIPLSSQSLLEAVRDAAHEYNVEVTWYRRGSHPVAVMRLQADHARPTVLLQRLDLLAGRLVVAGRSFDGGGSKPVTTVARLDADVSP